MVRDRLDTVARLRKLAEDKAQAAASAATREEAEALEQAEDAATRLADHVVAGAALPAAQLLSLHLRGIAQAELVDAATEEYHRTRELRGEVHRRLRRIRSERASVDKLVERRAADRASAARNRAQRSLDELVLLQRDRDGGPEGTDPAGDDRRAP